MQFTCSALVALIRSGPPGYLLFWVFGSMRAMDFLHMCAGCAHAASSHLRRLLQGLSVQESGSELLSY